MDSSAISSQQKLQTIGFGGGCHWCTEAVFQALTGVVKTQQGWIASEQPEEHFSEAVIVSYDANHISLNDLILAHLHTHSSTSKHSMRKKYRSAVYYFESADAEQARQAIASAQMLFEDKIITLVLPFKAFKASPEKYQNYYKKNSDRPFCKAYITPKFKTLMNKFHAHYQTVEPIQLEDTAQ